jgi:hypothetical protein
MSGLILPEAFSSYEPPERVIGTETEYDAINPDGSLNGIWVSGLLKPEVLAATGLSHVATNEKRHHWLSNGAFLHPDCSLLEYCSPEAYGPYEATLASHAGNLVLARMLAASDMSIQIFRRAATVHHETGAIVTKGYHQNFCIPNDIANRANLVALETLFATQLPAWGGIVTKNGFNISPKAKDIGTSMITTISNRTTTGQKPFAIIRGTADGKDSDTNTPAHGYARLEDRTKTPSNQWSDFMGMATTSLTLRVREQPKLTQLNGKLSGLMHKNTIDTFRTVATDPLLKERYELMDGRIMSAVDTQEAMAEIAVALSTMVELPASEMFALTEWQKINDKLRRVQDGEASLRTVADRIGWAGKYVYLLKKFGEEAVARGDIEVLQACLNWDRIAPRGAGQIFYEKRGVHVATEAEAQRFVHNAPTQTRAYPRAELVKEDGRSGTVTSMRWPYATTIKGGLSTKYSWHPYQGELAEAA